MPASGRAGSRAPSLSPRLTFPSLGWAFCGWLCSLPSWEPNSPWSHRSGSCPFRSSPWGTWDSLPVPITKALRVIKSHAQRPSTAQGGVAWCGGSWSWGAASCGMRWGCCALQGKCGAVRRGAVGRAAGAHHLSPRRSSAGPCCVPRVIFVFSLRLSPSRPLPPVYSPLG